MRLVASLLALCFAVSACGNDPTEASVTNGFRAGVVEKVWFRTTLFGEPLAPGQSSEALRVGTGVEPAYAVVRIGDRAFVGTTSDPVRADPGETVSIVFSEETSRSLCFGAPPLSEEEEAFIASRIFPGEVVETDPARCRSE